MLIIIIIIIINVIDQTRNSSSQPLNIREIVDELEIFKDDYYIALPASKDEDLELHLKRQPNFCFFSNYFDVGLKAGQPNMNVQPVFNEYKAMMYMWFYF